jgi:hypothetical protein
MRSSFLQVASYLALAVPIMAACTNETHVVGSDDAGNSGSGDASSADASSGDAGNTPQSIVCGPNTCNGATEYCAYAPTCVVAELPDGGAIPNSNWGCNPLPSQCVGIANICQCVLSSLNPWNYIVDPDAGLGCTIFNECG